MLEAGLAFVGDKGCERFVARSGLRARLSGRGQGMLPDRDDPFHLVDEELASGEGFGPVRS